MKTTIMFLSFIAIIGLVFVACDPEPKTEIQKEFIVKVSDKDVLIKDERTDSSMQNLEAFGIISKLEDVLIGLDGVRSFYFLGQFRDMLNRGLIIIVENQSGINLAVIDDKSMSFDFDYLRNSSSLGIQNDIIVAIEGPVM